jgi:hypothetical protein
MNAKEAKEVVPQIPYELTRLEDALAELAEVVGTLLEKLEPISQKPGPMEVELLQGSQDAVPMTERLIAHRQRVADIKVKVQEATTALEI